MTDRLLMAIVMLSTAGSEEFHLKAFGFFQTSPSIHHSKSSFKRDPSFVGMTAINGMSDHPA